MAQSNAKSVSQELANRLKFSGLTQEAVRELADIAAEVHARAGLRDSRIFPIGIPAPDGVGIKGNISVDDIDRIKELLGHDRRIRGVHVFPIGIPAPDVLRVAFDIR